MLISCSHFVLQFKEQSLIVNNNRNMFESFIGHSRNVRNGFKIQVLKNETINPAIITESLINQIFLFGGDLTIILDMVNSLYKNIKTLFDTLYVSDIGKNHKTTFPNSSYFYMQKGQNSICLM